VDVPAAEYLVDEAIQGLPPEAGQDLRE
jgi:hypothetical protein